MSDPFVLKYGDRRVELALPPGSQTVEAPAPPAPRAVERVLEEALDAPIRAAPLEARRTRRPLVIVSDASRADPRTALLRAVLGRLPDDAEVTVAIANGTHAPGDPAALGLPRELLERVRLVNHDGHDPAVLVELGRTRRGTPVRVHRCLTETDLVVATGTIRPHYFAGYGAGVKAIFPGLGGNDEIRINHLLKREPKARAGVVDGNPCRDDLEEALPMLPAPAFLLNTIVDSRGGTQGAVAGDVREAFRQGAGQCDPLFRVRAPRRRAVVVSDRLPVTESLYQASKLVAAAAPLLAPDGVVVLVAPCPKGVGPLETVNRGIYELGLAPRLPPGHRVILVSEMPRETVECTYCEWAPSVQAALDALAEPALVLPSAATVLAEALLE